MAASIIWERTKRIPGKRQAIVCCLKDQIPKNKSAGLELTATAMGARLPCHYAAVASSPTKLRRPPSDIK